MRECHQNFAHGPMKIRTESVEVEYRDEMYSCEKTVYACTQCDFVIEQDWMKKKMKKSLEEAYLLRHPEK